MKLDRLNREPKLRAYELELCRRNVVHFMNNWVWTYDPRAATDGSLAHIPFNLLPRQIEFINWLDARVTHKEEGLCVKSRDVGYSWMTCGYAVHKWRFVDGFKTTFGSRKEEYVDKSGDPDSLFEKVRMIILGLPWWMKPMGLVPSKHFNYLRTINPVNGNLIRGEAGDQMGRGGRSSLYLIDEAAFLERAERVNAATSANSDVRIWGSTVNGPGTMFSRKWHGGGLEPRQIFTFNYRDNPLMTPERIAKKKKELEPWEWAAEYECDDTASVEGIAIPGHWVTAAKQLKHLIKVEPYASGVAGGDIGAGKAKSVWVPRYGPVVRIPIAWGQPDTTETAIRMLDASQAAKEVRSDRVECFIHSLRYDSVGVGKGVESTLSRAYRQGLTTIGVNVGDPPTDTRWPDGKTAKEKFSNLKAESWWAARERFKHTYEMVLFLTGQEGGIEHEVSGLISLPDDSESPEAMTLAAQISLVKAGHDEKGKIAIESKKELTKRGIKSPDYADALMLTFTGTNKLELWAQMA